MKKFILSGVIAVVAASTGIVEPTLARSHHHHHNNTGAAVAGEIAAASLADW
ncbi:hypothetical protein FHT71_004067 [Rhizobium sp. BK060]|nr:hypothetical protein [Rhizobium sp. BK060]